MGYETINFIYLSEILNLPVVNASGSKRIGTIVDLAATTIQVYPKVTGVITRVRGSREPVYIPWNRVRRTTFSKDVSIDYSPDLLNGQSGATEHEILLKKSFLDRQIISTSGNKLVRVNDLQLLIDNSTKENPNLWLVHIDIGAKGLLRRLGFLRVVNSVFRWIVSRDLKDKFVSWKHVQPTTTTDVYGSLHLKTDASKLSEIHPADLADILEDLGTDERTVLIESLDPATAAATMQQMSLRVRLQIAESLDLERLAAIINEMQMDETVDLLDELPDEKRRSIFHLLPAEKVAEINELSQLATNKAGSIMNTDYVLARTTQTVREVLKSVKTECWKAEVIYYIYVIDPEERLRGVVTLRNLLSAKPSSLVSSLMTENPITVKVDTGIKRVSQLFFKYDFQAIPVVDDDDHIQGIITLHDTLESVFPEVKEEAKG